MTTPKKQQQDKTQTTAETTQAPAETTKTAPAPAETVKTADTTAEADKTTQDSSDTADTVVLRTPPFLDAYVVAGTTITREGTRVPAHKVDEILAAAKRARVKLEQPR